MKIYNKSNLIFTALAMVPSFVLWAKGAPIMCPLSLGFPRQEYWSGLLFPSQEIFLTQGWNLRLQPHLLHCRQIRYH